MLTPATSETPTAAVAVVVRHLGEENKGPEVLLGVRRSNPRDPWSGHIAFPGGRCEHEDVDLLQTAIRECLEESTVVLSRNSVLGCLPPVQAGGREHPTLVQPWLFRGNDSMMPRTGDGEIEHWFWYPLCELDHSENQTQIEIAPNHRLPAIRIGDRVLWGMTLSILKNLWENPLCTPRQLWLDYDGTLYPESHPIVQAVDVKITQWVAKARNLAFDEADTIRRTLYSHHGNTLQGMMREDDIDPHAYLDFVFDLPDSILPSRNDSLIAFFDQLKIPSVIFTNARADYTRRGLISIGIESYIQRIHDIESFVWRAKPNPSIYHEMLLREGILPQHVLFADDRWDNLPPALDLGITAVWIDEHEQHAWNVPNQKLQPMRFWKLRSAHELTWILHRHLGWQ